MAFIPPRSIHSPLWLILALCLETSGLSWLPRPESAAAATVCPRCGDVNCDGIVDVVDALAVGQIGVGMRASATCIHAADVNVDRRTDITDALHIAQQVVGMRSEFRCAPVVRALVPAALGSEGGERVRVSGGNFAPGASIAVEDRPLQTTYVDCETLDFNVLRHAPGSFEVTVVNPDGLSGTSPIPLVMEAPFRNVTSAANLHFIPRRGNDLMPIAGGVAVGDCDGDDRLDIFVPNHAGPNALFRNRGDGTFEDIAMAAGIADRTGRGDGACLGDYDNDGDLDLYITNYGPNRFFRNQGDCSFVDQTAEAGVTDGSRGTGCSWGDFDADGFLDLYVSSHLEESDPSVFITRRFDSARRSDRLFRNRGDGTFEDATRFLGQASLLTGAGFGASFVDYDNDGDSDVYLVNDFGREVQPNVLWRNDGPRPEGWRFEDVSAASGARIGIFGMGLAIGDYDTDGLLDFYVTNIGRNVLLRARGGGTFEDRTQQAGVGRELLGDRFSVGWGTAFFDYDNDSDLDLYLVAGYLDSDPLTNPIEQPNALFRNRGNGTFEDVSDVSGADDAGYGRGLALADFNRDGHLDLLVVNLGQGLVLLENSGRGGGHWLEVKLVGTTSNRDGIGARLAASAGGRTLIREVTAGDSHMSQSDLTVHFGLGSATSVDQLRIDWPSGIVQTLRNVGADQRLVVSEP
jgi:hypothetical protein